LSSLSAARATGSLSTWFSPNRRVHSFWWHAIERTVNGATVIIGLTWSAP